MEDKLTPVRVCVETPFDLLEGVAEPDQDFDGRFLLTTDDGETFWVNGWQCAVSFPNGESDLME